MGKYTFLGLFLAIAFIFLSVITINHGSNTIAMQEIDTGIKTTVLGQMRNSDTGSDGYGMRAKDTVAIITEEVTQSLANTNKITTIDFKFYSDEEGNNPIAYDTAISQNSVIKSVQYRVNLYNTKDVTINASGETVIKEGAQSESSTENRIVLNQNL